MDTINLNINFISGSEEIIPSNTAQTGDVLALIMTFLILVVLVFVGVLLFSRFQNITELKESQTVYSPKMRMPKHLGDKPKHLFFSSNYILKFLLMFVTAIITFSIIGLIHQGNAFASNGEGPLQPSTNNITATIYDDGSVEFTSCDLLNVSEEAYTLAESSVSICEDVKSIKALENSRFTVYGFDNVVYEGNPDGEPFYPINAGSISSGDKTTINFSINNIDKSSLLALIGKQVFSISLVPIKSYKVDFDVQGHGVQPEPFNNVAEGEKIIPPAEPEEAGWLFNGWFKEAGCINVWNFDTDVVTNNITLYAKWTPIEYSVRFNSNGGQGSMPDQTFKYGQSQNLTENLFQKDHYTFIGWAESASGDIKYLDKEPVINLSSVQGSVVNLYAKWTPVNYTITWETAGGSSVSGGSQNYTIESDTITLSSTPTKNAYVFTGWLASGEGISGWPSGAFDEAPTLNGAYGNVTLTAQYTAVDYSITWNTTGGSGAVGGSDKYTIESTLITLPSEPSKDGYTFAGWLATGEDIHGWPTVAFKESPELDEACGDVELLAQWTEKTYTIQWDSAGGGEVVGGSQSYTISSTTIALPSDPKKTGYTFKGWKASGGTNWPTDPFKNPPTLSYAYGDVTLTAQWELIQYSITWVSDIEVTGGSSSYTIESTNINLPTAPSKDHYDFSGWLASGEEISGWPQEVFKVSPTLNKAYGDVTLTAKWAPVQYSITWDSDGGSQVSGGSVSYTIESTTITLASDPEKDGWTFTGWKATGGTNWPTDVFVAAPTLNSAYGNVTLTAQWLEGDHLYYGIKDSGSEKTLYLSGRPTINASTLNDEALVSADKTDLKWNNSRFELASVVIENTIRPISTAYWFSNLTNCTSIEMSKLSTSRTTNMKQMFMNCIKLVEVHVSNLDTSKVISMQQMFYLCETLRCLDLSNFNTVNVTDMRQMFEGCLLLEWILVSDSFVTDKVIGDFGLFMFASCNKLVGGNGTTYSSSNVGNEYAKIDGKDGNPGYFCDELLYYGLENNLDGVTLYLSNSITEHSKTLSRSALWASKQEDCGWNSSRDKISRVVVENTIRPNSTACWFQSLANCTSIDLSKLSTSRVTNMNKMFVNCPILATVNVSNFDTSKVTSMLQMFAQCFALRDLDLSSFNTVNLTNTTQMFLLCTSLECIKVSEYFVTNNVPDGGSAGMFNECEKLVGGNGTTYDQQHINKEYAWIDGREGKKGYFTAAS